VDNAEEIMWSRSIGFEEVCRSFDYAWVREPYRGSHALEPLEARRRLQETMWEHVGIIRDEQGLKTAAAVIDDLYARLGCGDDPLPYYEVANMLTAARVMAQAALWRQESRGAHFRRDFPLADDLHWLHHLVFQRR
jgi:L-aspartate oxidase